jgi:hypothetical protein
VIDLNRDRKPEIVIELKEGLVYASLDRPERRGFTDYPIWERRWWGCGVEVTDFLDLEGDGYDDIWVSVSDGDSSWIEVIGGAPGEPTGTKRILGKVEGSAFPAHPPNLPHRPALRALAVTMLGERRVVVAVVDHDHTRKQRALVFFDAASGRVVWSKPFPGPIWNLSVCPSDDGAQPVVVGGTYASANDVVVDTLDCMHAYLYALGGNGEIVWLRSFPHLFTGWNVCRAPWDPDGSVLAWRLGAAPDATSDMGSLLLLDRRTGKTRRHFAVPRPFTSLITVDLDRDEIEEIVVGNADGVLRVLDANLNLLAEHPFEGSVSVHGSADFSGDGKPEICATSRSDLLILKADLTLLARKPCTGGAEVIRIRGEKPLVVTEERSEGFRIYSLERRWGVPPGVSRPLLAATFLAGAVASGIGFLAFRAIRGERARREEALWLDLRSLTREWNHGKCASNVTNLRDIIHDGGWRSEEGLPRFHEDLGRFQLACYPLLEKAHRCARSLNLPSLPALPKYPKEWRRVVENSDAGTLAETAPPRSILRFLDRTYVLSLWLVDQVRRRFLCEVESEILGAVRSLGSKESLEDVRFRVEMEGRPSRAYVDALDFRVVVENLVRNALTAMQGTLNKEIAFRVRSSALGTEVFVEDTGPGVRPELRDRLFDEGVTGTPGGSGQGLRQCREILERYKGTIARVEGEGRGACFRIRLQPIARRDLEGERK